MKFLSHVYCFYRVDILFQQTRGLVVIWDIKKKDEIDSFEVNNKEIIYLYELNDQRLVVIENNYHISIFRQKLKFTHDLSWMSLNSTHLIQLKDQRLILNSNTVLHVLIREMVARHLRTKERHLPPKPFMIIPNAHETDITCLLLLRCGNEFATASKDATIKIWETTKLACQAVLYGHTDTINFFIEKITIKSTKKNKGIENEQNQFEERTQSNEGMKNISEEKP